MKSITPLASRTLVIAGLVLVLTALLDYVILLVPPNFEALEWKIGLAGQMVDRGIVPLVGITFILVGSWIGDQMDGRRSGSALPLASLVVASVLGLIFLLLVPFHVMNAQAAQKQQLTTIQEQATQAATGLPGAVANQVQEERGRIQALLQNEAALNQAIASGQIQGEQVTLLQQFKDKPASIDSYLQGKGKEEEARLQGEIKTRTKTATEGAKTVALKSTLRTGLSSLLLAIAYAVVGWTGLRAMRQ